MNTGMTSRDGAVGALLPLQLTETTRELTAAVMSMSESDTH
jgi:hypothetical protein